MRRIMGPRFLYLHGFASGPDSVKGHLVAEHYAAKGVEVERLDLRQPSFPHLRFSKMLEHARAALGGAQDRAVIIGSSLGGLTAARLAEEDARVAALVLLAPAFRFAERWRKWLGEEEFARYRETGWHETYDHHEKRTARVDFGFFEDVERVDARNGGWPDVRVPVLIVHGVQDDVVDIEESRTWARGKRHVWLVEVEDGHELARSIPRILDEADLALAGFLGA